MVWNARAASWQIIYALCTCGSRDLIIYLILNFQSWVSSLQMNKAPQLNLQGTLGHHTAAARKLK